VRFSTFAQVNFYERLQNIRAFIFGIDGVLTDGKLLLLDNGEWLRQMHIKDGVALSIAVQERYRVCALTDYGSEAIKIRLQALGVSEFFFEVRNRLAIMEQFAINHELSLSQFLYVGYDLPDLEAMKASGVAICPQDAAPEIKNIAHYVTSSTGGQGCVREAVEMVLKAHGKWPSKGD
jgi:3-deoxy-D-manno-octulosonate 8-phosphate phosphatase (KDO 8-P phosphatase)